MQKNILILADPKGNAWDFATSVYNKLTCKNNQKGLFPKLYENTIGKFKNRNEYELREISIEKFPSREIFPKISGSIRNKECYLIHDSSMDPQDWLVSAQFLDDAFMRSSAKELTLVSPFMPYNRQDRLTEPGTPISAKVVAKTLNMARFITSDLHNPTTMGFFNAPFDNLKAYPTIIEHLKVNYKNLLNNLVILSPDAGSAPRAESYADRLGIDYAIAHKKRRNLKKMKTPGEVEKMTIIGDVEGKNVLITDDMFDTCGTVCTAASILKDHGAKDIYAAGTHGIFSGPALERIEASCLEKVIITDSIPQKRSGKIEIVDLSGLFAEAIYRTSHGISVSELFK